MGIGVWIAMIIVSSVIMIPAILFINGKGGFLLAGYNTMSPDKKARYNEKVLLKFVGWLLIIYVIGLLLGILMFDVGINWFGSAIMVIIHLAFFAGLIYANIGKRFRTNTGINSTNVMSPEDILKAEKEKKIINAVVIIISAITLIGVGLLFYFGEKEPVVNVTTTGINIRAMYGVNINMTEINEISLLENSMRDIGIGIRTNGYGGFGIRLKGYFQTNSFGQSLLFVNANSSPTIHISRKNANDIFISFNNGDVTRSLYQNIITAFPDVVPSE